MILKKASTGICTNIVYTEESSSMQAAYAILNND